MSLLPDPAAPCALPDSPLAHVRAGIDACVHCGFCLQACPTYVNLEDENDSPRGRILLMRSVLEGTLPVDDPDVRTHIDRCLGCRACETACPSGVPYGHMLEAMRATLGERKPPPLLARLMLAVFAHRWLLTPALLGARLLRATGLPRVLARVLPARAGFAMAMLASTTSPIRRRRPRARPGAPRATVTTLTGCVMRGLFAHVHGATHDALTVNGYRVVATRGQGCCGALHAHAGDLETARALARTNVAAFERTDAEYIAINSAGCGAMIKEYGDLLADDPAWADRARAVAARARDVSELLAQAGPTPATGTRTDRVTYDAPCHLLHAQRVASPPLTMLAAVRAIDLVALEDADQCCGSAGIYNLIEPETSDAVLTPKLARIAETNATLVATGNPGCLMQLGAGLLRSGSPVRVVHPVELLADAYADA